MTNKKASYALALAVVMGGLGGAVVTQLSTLGDYAAMNAAPGDFHTIADLEGTWFKAHDGDVLAYFPLLPEAVDWAGGQPILRALSCNFYPCTYTLSTGERVQVSAVKAITGRPDMLRVETSDGGSRLVLRSAWDRVRWEDHAVQE